MANLFSQGLTQGFNTAKRIGQTAKTVGFAGIRVANGEKLDAILVRETFEQLGTTYIKLGQFIASSPSLFPKSYVEEFQKCLDQTPPISFNYIKQVVATELYEVHGKQVDEVFASIDSKPLASASIAQVHSAKLVTGENVVIKVQKPHVETILNTDLSVVLTSMKIAERMLPKMKFASLSQIIDEIKKRMVDEANFIKEAQNIAEFKKFLKQTNNTQVTAPEVYKDASTAKLLTMERFYGVPMTDVNQMQRYCDKPSQVLTTTLNTWFASLTLCNHFHADLHAGNLMLLEDGRIGFIDFGIVGQLKPESWRCAIGFMHAISQSNYDAMAENMLGMGMTEQHVDTKLLAKDLEHMFAMFLGNTESVLKQAKKSMQAKNNANTENTAKKRLNEAEELNQIMLEVVQVGERHGICFPRDFTLLIKQFLYFDRFMQVISPDMDIFNDARVNLLGN